MSVTVNLGQTSTIYINGGSPAGTCHVTSTSAGSLDIDLNPYVVAMICGMWFQLKLSEKYDPQERGRIVGMINNSSTRQLGLALIEDVQLRQLASDITSANIYGMAQRMAEFTNWGYQIPI